MNTKAVISELQQKYPGKNIFLLPKDNPTEILCEIDPALYHPDYSVAVSVIDKSGAHVHDKITERYTVLRGSVTLTINNVPHSLYTGDSMIIRPGEIHFAEGKASWIECVAKPAWTPDDHHLV